MGLRASFVPLGLAASGAWVKRTRSVARATCVTDCSCRLIPVNVIVGMV
jgi:hypothetical protein